MSLTNDDLQAIATLIQGAVKNEITPLQEDIKSIRSDITNIQDDLTDIKIQLNNIDNNLIKTRQQVLRGVKRLNDMTDIAFEDVARVDTKIDQHINDNKKHSA